MSASPSQLEMIRKDLSELPALEIPPDCELRTFQPGDEAHWARIMNDCIGRDWTAERCRAELVERIEFRADGCFMAVMDGEPQGSASSYVLPAFTREVGYVHMVGVAPAYRGLGLGVLVTCAVLHWFRDNDFKQALLRTDDWRLPAIGSSLKLGFEPVVFNDSHAERWDAVRANLAQRGI